MFVVAKGLDTCIGGVWYGGLCRLCSVSFMQCVLYTECPLVCFHSCRSDIVEVLSTYQFYDENDAFAREPYGVLVSSIFPGTCC